MYKVVNKQASDDVVIMDESGKKVCMIVKSNDLTPLFYVYTCERRPPSRVPDRLRGIVRTSLPCWFVQIQPTSPGS